MEKTSMFHSLKVLIPHLDSWICIVESELEKKTIVLYIDCREKKTFARKLMKWHKYSGDSINDINAEVMIDTVEDDFDRLFIEHGMMSKCGSLTNTQYNTNAYNR